MSKMCEQSAFVVPDLDLAVLPGGGDEPVLHVPLAIAVVYAVWSTPAV